MSAAFLDCETFKAMPGRKAPRLVCVSFGTIDRAPRLYHRTDWRDWLAELVDALRHAEEVGNHNLAFDLAVLLVELRRLHAVGKVSKAVLREVSRLVWALHDEDRARDTMVTALLLGIAKGEPATTDKRKKKGLHGWALDECCGAYLGERPTKKGDDHWRLRYHELDGVPLCDWPAEAIAYASADPVWAHRLYAAERAYVNGARPRSELRQTRAAWVMTLAECWGVRTDPRYVAALAAHLEREISDGYAKIRALIGNDGWLRPDGTKDEKHKLRPRIQSVLQAAGIWDPRPGYAHVTKASKKFPQGQVKKDRPTLELCGEHGAEDLKILASIGASLTDRNTFIKPLRAGVALPVNPRWFVCVESGRLSCKAPNLTNQPTRTIPLVDDQGRPIGSAPQIAALVAELQAAGKPAEIGVRHGFVPRPGWLYSAVDYSTAELRAFAQICLWWFGQSAMADALIAEAAAKAAGQPALDLHSKFAARILSIDEDEAVRRRYAGDAAFKQVRELAKRINFGCLGMMGAGTFLATCQGQDFDLTLGGLLGTDPLRVARHLLALWHQTWPEVPLYFDRIGQWLRKSGGRTFRAVSIGDGLVRGNVKGPEGANHYFQNFVSQWLKSAWYLLARESYLVESSDFYGSRIVIAPHDELIAEVPEHKAHKAAMRQSAVMTQVADAMAPDVPHEALPALMRRWYKGAEPVYNAQKELVPWEPKAKAA